MKVIDGLTRDEAATALRSIRHRHPALGWTITGAPSEGEAGYSVELDDADAVGMDDVVAEEARRVRPPRHRFLEGARSAARALTQLPSVEPLRPTDGWVHEIELALTYRLSAPLGPSFDGFVTEEVHRTPGGVALRGDCWIFTAGSSAIREPFEAELALDATGDLGRFALRCGRPATVSRAKLVRTDEAWTVYGLSVRVSVDEDAPWAFEVLSTGTGTGTEER